MAHAPLRSAVLRLLRSLPPADGTDDAALLERFVAWHDESAFELLVFRHAPMVRGVCRRLLRHEQDAEDAFQATFLTLARKAAAVRGASLPGWLYRVAYHAALKARTRHRTSGPAPEPADHTDPADAVLGREVRAVLDDELMRLPERFRRPVVLCYLQGKTNSEAAAELGCPRGTVDSRLAEARRRLKLRLVRRGLAPAAGLALESALAAPDVTAAVVRPAVRAALAFVANQSGAAPTAATLLAQGVLHTMLVNQLKWGGFVLLALCLIGTGGVATYGALAGDPQDKSDRPPAKATPKALEPSAANPGAAVATARPAGPGSTREVRQLLRVPAGLDQPLDQIPLRDALAFLSDKFGVTIRIDVAAFARSNIENPLELYDQPVQLPVVRGLTVGEVLREIVAQVRPKEEKRQPIAFLARGTQIVLVPAFITPYGQSSEQPFLTPDVIEEQILGDWVSLDVQDKPLANVLRDLADQTGANIVLDGRQKAKSDTAVTLTLQQVRLFKALQVIADMAELKPVVLHNVYYVTDAKNVERLEKREGPRPEPVPPPQIVVPGGLGFGGGSGGPVAPPGLTAPPGQPAEPKKP